MAKHFIYIAALGLLAAIVLFLIVEILIVKFNGEPVPPPDIPRAPQTLGSGPAVTYVVMGDSTAISQGSDYKAGFAVASANHLAKHYRVTTVNTGISGAKAKDVLNKQLSEAMGYKPDIVLLAVGANDATHFTSSRSFQDSLQKIINGLKQANPAVHIIVTGSPAMGSLSRFPFGAKQLMALRTRAINSVFEPIIQKNGLTLAPIAEKTGAAFLADPTLTAADNFHPNSRGYALWIPVINAAIDRATTNN